MKYNLAVTPIFSQKKSFQLDQALKCLQNKKLLCFNMHDQIITKKKLVMQLPVLITQWHF